MSDLRGFLEQTFEQAGGDISFENFMALALYDPRFGYYSRSIEEIGGDRGDFSTSATLTEAMGKAIARWLLEEQKHHEWEGATHLIEVGPGNGDLARDVLKALGWWKRRAIRLHLVEVSTPLRERQQTMLKSRGISWHASMEEALESAEGRALIYSNELVDAFPAKWLVWDEAGGQWQEVHVAWDSEKGLREVFKPLLKGFPEDEYSAMGPENQKPGQRIEIQPLYQRWLGNLSQHWKEGSMLTVDYGGDPNGTYERRPEGTMRAYYRQQRVERAGIYQRLGKQDLTTDVNFVDLVNWGEELGFETASLESQSSFLKRYQEGADLMGQQGVGEAFQVLVQRRTRGQIEP